MSEREEDYLVFHFYLPEYDMQSTPIVVPFKYYTKYGLREAILRARDDFLSNLRGSTEAINPKHLRLWEDGRIQYKLRLRRLPSRLLQTYRYIRIRHGRERT
jgi:hypothetical protein